MIVADNGATKSEWYLTGGSETKRLVLPGYNPSTASENNRERFRNAVLANFRNYPYHGPVFFYSAGVAAERPRAAMVAMLKEMFGGAEVFVETDLTGAARALFGNKKGIAAILGTGANAGYFDGYRIVHQPKSLGFLLGDEGSGAYLGKMLLKAYLEKTLPAEIANHITSKLKNYPEGWVQQALKHPAANEYGYFAAEIMPFRNHDYVINTVKKAFDDFFRHIVSRVNGPENAKIGFAGKVADTFSDILFDKAAEFGYQPVQVIRAPAEKLFEWHQKQNT